MEHNYIVTERFCSYPTICTGEDGITLVFSTIEEAQKEANSCQDGLVVPLNLHKLFTEQDVVESLIAFDKILNPESYKEIEKLSHEDFIDLLSNITEYVAIQFDLKDKFITARKMEQKNEGIKTKI